MADYQPLIARAIYGLETNTGEARRALYGRARDALVTQLRGMTPALSESDITRERLALEEAIRKIESEQARKSRPGSPATTGSPATAPAPEPPAPEPPKVKAEESQGKKPEPPKRPVDDQPSSRGAAASGGQATPFQATPVQATQVQATPVQAPPPPASAAVAAEPRRVEADARDTTPPRKPEFRLPAEPPAPERPMPAEPQSRMPPRESGAPLSAQGLKDDRDLSGKPERAEARPSPAPAAPGPQDQGRLNRELDMLANEFERAPRPQAPPPQRPQPPTARPQMPPPPSPRPDVQRQAAGAAQDTIAGQPDLGAGRPAGNLKAPPEPDLIEEQTLPPPVPRRSGRILKLVVSFLLLALLGGLAGAAFRERGALIALYDKTFHGPTRQASRAPQTPPKIEDRVGPGQPERPLTPNRQGQPAPKTQPPPAVAQRVVLYEEDPKDPKGKRYVGSVIWRTETVSPGRGLAPELAVRATIEVPERQMTMTFSMVRNTDPALPASHTIDIRFKLPANFSSGGVASVPGILMKQTEQARGVPLAGLAVKVTDNVFLIGLSAVEADVERNTQLLKERPWFDIPIVYSNGSRAILAMEKGTPGERAFNEAFTAWGKASTAAAR